MVHWFWIKVSEILLGGVLSLADYLSLHVLLCLIPAFFIAGAMVVFIPKDLIRKYIGKDSKKIIAYPVAAISGFLLAVCSCTVLPLFAGIKKKGAGLGPAMTFLFSAPAVNILALTYTGSLIGVDIAVARAILALVFAIVIGLLMDLIFKEKKKNQNTEEEKENEELRQNSVIKERKKILLSDMLKWIIASLVVFIGVLIAFLNKRNLQSIGVTNPALIQTIIWIAGLILLITSFFIIENPKTNIFIGLIYLLFTGTSQISYFPINLSFQKLAKTTQINFFDSIMKLHISTASGSTTLVGTLDYLKSKAFVIDLANMGIKATLSIIVVIVIAIYVLRKFDKEDGKEWMKETWSFVKKIFPYLILGVFLAGMLRVLLLPTQAFLTKWIGRNTVVANFFGVTFGVVAYFPTLMEVPIAQMFLDLGMSRGVLLAYLLADPELSIQSILVTRKFIGDKKNLVYVLLVVILAVLAGLLFGLIIAHEPITFV